jgi:hypothetical protein
VDFQKKKDQQEKVAACLPQGKLTSDNHNPREDFCSPDYGFHSKNDQQFSDMYEMEYK